MFKSIDPATGGVVGGYPRMPSDTLEDTLNLATDAQREWARVPLAERSRLMNRAAEVLLAHKDRYVAMMISEMGKVRKQGSSEIEKCAWGCRFFADNAERFLRPETVDTEAWRSFVDFRPLGVILAIMPWNFPYWQVLRFAAPALIAGNGCLLKHAPNVFGCAMQLEALFVEAGFPENLFRALIIDIPETTRIIGDPRIAAVTMTSSVDAGRAVAREAGKALKKCVLELGGSDPFIVLEDAEIDRAVETGVIARFQNSGQSCIAAKRFIIVEAVYEEFEQKFMAAVDQLKMGDPGKEEYYIGPLARVDLRDRLADQVQRSVAAGARILTGGEVPSGPGAYYPPTVLVDVKPGMAAWSEELFGPVATLIRVADEAEAIRVANDTEFGLGGSVWTSDLKRGERIVTEELQAGTGFVNALTKSDPRLPFGGILNSGYGRELSIYGVREFVNIHSVWIDPP